MYFLIFFLILSKSLLANHHPCNDTQPDLISNGPCDKFVTFCDGGLPFQFECPDFFFFNPVSKFCEKIYDFIQQKQPPPLIVPTQPPPLIVPTPQPPPLIVPTPQPPALIVPTPNPLPLIVPAPQPHLPLVDPPVLSVYVPPPRLVYVPPPELEERFISEKSSAFAPMNSLTDVGHDAFLPSPPLSFIQSGFAPINSHVDFGHDIFNTRIKRSANDIDKCLELLGNYSKPLNETPCTHAEIPGGCRQFYFACVNGTRIERYCPLGLFFNSLREVCQRREQIQTCLPTSIISNSKPSRSFKVSPRKHVVATPARPVLPSYSQYYPEKFCSELPDGFYKHPRNHSRVLQCFSHQLFEYPSCLHGLVFDEARGVCGYPDFATKNVSVTFCAGGHHHGDHVAHPEKCTSFYRCVWGRLFPMSCPLGTVFNSRLSVCDYPKNVPNCN
uniref:Chitin-binding type-2 domain-containing protein n=3 Tax=Meloidogyne TaxID=189290 RepID=A0A915MG24_MELJA